MVNRQNKNRERLDNYLVSQGYFDTKSQAQGAVLSGKVKVNGEIITKAGTQIKSENIDIKIKHMPYVSRGAFKLEKAVKEFFIEINDKICIDIGASTGGFSDFLLQNGAKKVYAIDVGYGQLAWKLRNDPRIVVLERTNIKNVESLDDTGDLVTVDVSFISVLKIMEKIKTLMSLKKQEVVLLIKPQFEAGKEYVPKSGVIKDKNIHIEVIKKIVDFSDNTDLIPTDLTYSPIKGPAGNIEFLLYLTNNSGCVKIDENKIIEVVNNAHENL